MKKKTIYISSALVGLMLLSACNDNDYTYEWAEADSADCMGVYFDSSTPEEYLIMEEADLVQEIKVFRTNAANAADVPLVGKCDSPELVFPSSIHFDAGQTETSFQLDFSNLPLRQAVIYSITVPDEYLKKYSENYFNIKSKVVVSKWEPANQDGSPVKFVFTSSFGAYDVDGEWEEKFYETIESEMLVLPGASRFRVLNFLGSGVDVTFSLTPSTLSGYDGYYRIMPLDHWIPMYEAYEDDLYEEYKANMDEWANPYFVVNYDKDGNWDYVTADLHLLKDGSACPFEYLEIYSYSVTDGLEYSVAWLKSDSANSTHYNGATMYITGYVEKGNAPSLYPYVNFRWDGSNGQ